MNLHQVIVNARNRGNLAGVLGLLRSTSDAAEWHERLAAALKASGSMPPGWWTRERCLESALRYETRKAWLANENSACQIANRNDWSECFAHFDMRVARTLEECKAEASRYKTRAAWRAANRTGKAPCFSYATTHRWLDACCGHMPPPRKQRTKEDCIASALRYKTRNAWRLGDAGAYQAAFKNEWLAECYAHMKILQRDDWTLGECKASALKYKTKVAWRAGDPTAYGAAYRNRWYGVCCAHMKPQKRNAWTLAECQSSALKYKTLAAWERGECGAYGAAFKKRWLDKCCAHMVPGKTENGWWTKARCMESAAKYETRSAWQRGACGAYNRACERGWYDACVAHMGPPLGGRPRSKP
jgi:hypothetical protein